VILTAEIGAASPETLLPSAGPSHTAFVLPNLGGRNTLGGYSEALVDSATTAWTPLNAGESNNTRSDGEPGRESSTESVMRMVVP
jgi:hypothetical protein